MKKEFNVLSLFDGISTGRLCLEQAQIKVNKYYSSEIDEKAMMISKKNWKDIEYLGNVEEIEIERLPKIDLIIGGSPCQGFSRNGKGLNFEDERSRLFFIFVEVLEKLKIKNPDIKFMLENVEMKKEWEDVITDVMNVKPIKINSKVMSPQNRPRIYWTNINVSDPGSNDADLYLIIDKDIDTTNYIKKDGLLIDNSISKDSIEIINVVDGEIRIKQATKKGYIIAESGDGINLSFPKSKHRRGRVIKRKTSTLDCNCDVCFMYDGIIRKPTISELEQLQTLPIGYTQCKGISDRERKKAIGNGWTAAVITHIFKGIKQEVQKHEID